METRKPMEILPEERKPKSETRKTKLETWKMMAERENRVNAQKRAKVDNSGETVRED